MRGSDVIQALEGKLRASSNRALANQLGVTVQAIHNWNKRTKVTPRQIAGLVSAARKSSKTSMAANSIRPIVEFYPVDRCPSKHGAKYELFDAANHPYRQGVRDELSANHGIYIFFDSRGQAIYTGKARQQNLWREITNAFNRDRGEVQKIKRVRHPERRVEYRNSQEKLRQISDHVVPLHDLAAYFSAYEIAEPLINKMEAMLVRSFANDLLNVRLEKFAAKSAKKGKVKRRRRK